MKKKHLVPLLFYKPQILPHLKVEQIYYLECLISKCISNMSCPDWIQHIPFDIYFYVLQKNERTYYSQK